MKKLKINKNFKPCSVEVDDELYPNGIFEFRQLCSVTSIAHDPETGGNKLSRGCITNTGCSSGDNGGLSYTSFLFHRILLQ